MCEMLGSGGDWGTWGYPVPLHHPAPGLSACKDTGSAFRSAHLYMKALDFKILTQSANSLKAMFRSWNTHLPLCHV